MRSAPGDASRRRTHRHCRALWWGSFRGRMYPVLPLRALVYAVIGAVLFLISMGMMEWSLERRSRSLVHDLQTASTEWMVENYNIQLMNNLKLHDVTYDSPLWRSRAFKVDVTHAENSRHRILVIGDSFVWGDGYANMNDLWWRQLQRELNRRGYWDVEVSALGWCGAATQDEFYWLSKKDWVNKLKPDVIVWGYVANDPDTAIGSTAYNFCGRQVRQLFHKYRPVIQDSLREKGLGYWGDRIAVAFPLLTYQLNERLVNVWEQRVASDTAGYPYANWELKLLEGANFEYYTRLLKEVRAFLDSNGTPCFFMTLPSYPSEAYFRPRHQAVAPEFKKAGLPFRDTLDAFLKEYPAESSLTKWGINPVNGHPGTRSAYFFARQAADILEKEYSNALGPKTPPPATLQPVINDWMPPWMGLAKSGPNELLIEFPVGPGAPKLFMPIRKPHVQLSFEHPVRIESVELEFPSPVTAELYASVVDGKIDFDTEDLIALGERRGTTLAWSLPRDLQAHGCVNTLRIAGNFLDGPQPIQARLSITFGIPSVQP